MLEAASPPCGVRLSIAGSSIQGKKSTAQFAALELLDIFIVKYNSPFS